MSKQQRTQRRYALTLYLVPDADVAGDIFMDTASEEQVVRRAMRWRRSRGLDRLEPPSALPELNEAQAAHALHLTRRGRIRRWARLTLGMLLASVVTVAGVMLIRASDLGAWAKSPVFRQSPAQTTSLRHGFAMSVYRAEVNGGVVTLWWELRGSAASTAGKSVEPWVRTAGARRWVAPLKTDTAVTHRDRVLGRSTYRIPVLLAPSLSAPSIAVRVVLIDGQQVDWQLSLPLATTAAKQGPVS